MFGNDPASKLLGMEIVSVGPGQAHMRMTVIGTVIGTVTATLIVIGITMGSTVGVHLVALAVNVVSHACQ